jgi:uncharacterized membrane protein
MTARTVWHGLRGLRWLLWAAFVIFALAYWLDPTKYHNQFGNLLLWVEAVMFGLPVAAVFVGFIEMMMRERAGIIRAQQPTER